MMKDQKPAKKHHYIPRFIMSAWQTKSDKGHNGILGFHWKGGRLEPLHRGLAYFGQQEHLYTLTSLGKEPDDVETIIFGKIDNDGARVIDKIKKTKAITFQESIELATLLLSLDTRRPKFIQYVRSVGIAQFEKEITTDPLYAREIADANTTPKAFYEGLLGHPLEDHFLLTALRTMINPAVFKQLVSSVWKVLTVPLSAETFLLGDRPVIREKSIDTSRLIWALPLSPRQVLIRAESLEDLDAFSKVSPEEIVRTVNEFTILQCDQFVFGVPGLNKEWVADLMEKRAAENYHDHTLEVMATALKNIGYAHGGPITPVSRSRPK